MKKRFLDFLVCPDCRTDGFELTVTQQNGAEILEGTLRCPGCQTEYPIIRGIPRLIKGIRTDDDLRKVYADSFGHEWTAYNWLRDEDEHEFFQITDLQKETLANQVVFDAGCGGGRNTRFLAGYVKDIIGLDFSIAVDKAYELCQHRENVHFVQCDINRNPFKPQTFDLVFSHGVLHHTPNTKKSFDNLPSLVKPGGSLYIAVFQKAFFWLRWTDGFWRSILNRLPIPVMDKVCGALSYLYYLPFATFWKRFFWFSLQKTHEIRKYCLYDWYAPTYHHEHTPEEVIVWFSRAGFSDVKYINAWPYCPPERKYRIPNFWDSLRLGRLLGVIGTKYDSTV